MEVFLNVLAPLLLLAVLLFAWLWFRQRRMTADVRVLCTAADQHRDELRKEQEQLKGKVEKREQQLQVLSEEWRRLLRSRLPVAAGSPNNPGADPGPAHPHLGDPFGPVVEWVAQQLEQTRADAAQQLEQARSDAAQKLEQARAGAAQQLEQTRADAAQHAKAMVLAMMRSIRSLAKEMEVAVSSAQRRFEGSEALEGLMPIDHAMQQLMRRAQAIAMLCGGSWPGQQRSTAPLIDVVRGAMSRIPDYLRVMAPPGSDVNVVRRVVEALVLTVAELLDNAVRHSVPSSKVTVNFQPVYRGVAIVIDDAGPGMTEETLQRAKWLLAGNGGHDIAELGDPPQVGLAAVGILSVRYGFEVSVDMQSPFGGVRAVVFVPSALLTDAEAPTPIAAATAVGSPSRQLETAAPDTPAAPTKATAERLDASNAAATDNPRTPGGLPVRQKNPRALLAFDNPGTPADGRHAQREQQSPTHAPKSGAALSAFARAVRAGRLDNPEPIDPEPIDPEPSGPAPSASPTSQGEAQ